MLYVGHICQTFSNVIASYFKMASFTSGEVLARVLEDTNEALSSYADETIRRVSSILSEHLDGI